MLVLYNIFPEKTHQEFVEGTSMITRKGKNTEKKKLKFDLKPKQYKLQYIGELTRKWRDKY